MRVALVSCVKTKKLTPAPAAELYTSRLFQGLRSYAEQHADKWYILSAKHGLVHPNQILEPYEKTLYRMSKNERDQWAHAVQSALIQLLSPDDNVLILAGKRYRENLVPFLQDHGHFVEVPLRGLSLGKQLQFLNLNTEPIGQ